MKKLELAERVRSIAPSATLAMTQRAAELQAKGIDVIAFGVGEPDFETPAAVRSAAKDAIDHGSSHYTRVRGTDALVAAIRSDCERRRGVAPGMDQIVVSVGAKHTLFNLAMVLYEPGDEILIPAPHWVSYPAHCELFGAIPVTVPTREEDGFRLSPETLEAAVTKKTKALILCTPSNPTGSAYTKAQLLALAEVLKKGDYWVIADEIYGELVYDGFEQYSLLSLAPELRERLIIVDGVSKTYAMTGWRIGWAIAPVAVAKAVEKIQGQSTTNPTAIAQHASTAALLGDKAVVAEMLKAFSERRRAIVDGLNALDHVRCIVPEGAFYAFPNVSGLIGRSAGGVTIEDDVALSMWLLDAARVAVVPGTAFAAPGYVRMSYATSLEKIEEGLARIKAAIATLR